MIKLACNRLISAVLAAAMFLAAAAVPVHAENEAPGKCVSDIYMAYAKNEEDAVKWLKNNGWEPISGNNDFNAGKASFWDNSAGHRDNVAVAMGIKRTNDAAEAVTDLAVMNMTGGYSIPAYENVLKEKKAEIDEFIHSFLPVIQEFRDNYDGKGSEYGKHRAELVNMILNRLYDGDPNSPDAANDTGLPLGELLRQPLRQEGNENGGDLQQILLESTGAAVSAIKQMLALASDTGKESWLERLKGLSGDLLQKNLSLYVLDAAGQNVSPSAAINYLKQHFGDAANLIAQDWANVHEKMQWYESYNEANDLWQHDGEEDAAYADRLFSHFEAIKAVDEDEYNSITQEYSYAAELYGCLYEVEYEGEWGATLGDFFNPADGTDYSLNEDNFLPFAAALSEGQRASLQLVSLSSLLLIGMGNDTGLNQVQSDLNELFGNDEITLSVYTGINRSIFRGGVAITSEALMEQNMGRASAYDKIWDHLGVVSIVSYVSAVLGVGMILASVTLMPKHTEILYLIPEEEAKARATLNTLKLTTQKISNLRQAIAAQGTQASEYQVGLLNRMVNTVNDCEEQLEEFERTVTSEMSTAGRTVLAIGGVLLVGAAVLKGVQMAKYYHRKFSPIPLMIVDESDIVTYLKDENGKPLLDENGKQLKNIDFKDYEYYEAVRCNRQEAGKIGDPQDGVDNYVEWGCGDVADLNADMGQEWLALYSVKSPNKGKPILADSLKLIYGSDKQPEGTTKCLHFFEYDYPMDMGDTAYAYNNKKGGVYFFWDEDVKAGNSQTASVFSAGHLAMAGIGGLILGVLGATIIMLSRRKKEKKEEA